MQSIIIPRRVLGIVNSCSKDNSRFQLANVLIERDEKGNCCAVATDAKQLTKVEWTAAEVETEWFGAKPEGEEPILSVIVQSSDLDRIAKSWPKGKHHSRPDAFVMVVSDDSHLRFRIPGDSPSDESEIKTRQCDGRFPAYRDVIPSAEGKIKLSLGVDVLEKLIKTRAKLVDDKTRYGITFLISPKLSLSEKIDEEENVVASDCYVSSCVRVEADNGVTGAIMPLHTEGGGWIDRGTVEWLRSDKIESAEEIDHLQRKIDNLEETVREANHRLAVTVHDNETLEGRFSELIDQREKADAQAIKLQSENSKQAREIARLTSELDQLRAEIGSSAVA